MNNIQVKMPSGEIIPVELISVFELVNLGKKYIFYTKGETVENNLIKMFASEVLKPGETVSLGDKMTEEEWSNLKNVMKSILTGSLNPNIKYVDSQGLSMDNMINLKETNVIALQQAQKEKLSGTYNSAPKEYIQNEPVVEAQVSTPADILQTEMPTPTIDFGIPVEPKVEPIIEPEAPIKEESIIEPAVVEDKYAAGAKRLEETQSLIEKELLSIINKINALQRDLDSLGEDIITFSNLYKVEPKEEQNIQPIKEEPIMPEGISPIKEEPMISEELLPENISPFSIGESQANIFD